MKPIIGIIIITYSGSKMPSQPTITLNELEQGQKAWLSRTEIGRKLEKRLLALGFSNAIPLQVVHKRPGGLVV